MPVFPLFFLFLRKHNFICVQRILKFEFELYFQKLLSLHYKRGKKVYV